MNKVIILCAVVSVAIAAVISEEAQAQILKYENINNGAGNYKFSFETSNGISREEKGYLVNVGKENEHIVVEGYFSYINPDGNLMIVRYRADENGYEINPPIVASQETYSLPPSVVATLLGK